MSLARRLVNRCFPSVGSKETTNHHGPDRYRLWPRSDSQRRLMSPDRLASFQHPAGGSLYKLPTRTLGADDGIRTRDPHLGK